MSEMLKLLDKIERCHVAAHNSYTRYMWRPGTGTGQKDHARFEKNWNEAQAAMRELRALIETNS